MPEVVKRELRVSLDRALAPVAFEILDQAPEQAAAFRLANISRTGMFLACAQEFQVSPGSSVHFAMRLEQNDENLTGVAKVRWVRRKELGPYQPRGVGLQVVAFDAQDEKKYLEFLESCLLQLHITDLMDANPITVTDGTSIASALGLLQAKGTDCLVVTAADKQPLGTFSFDELCRACGVSDFLTQPVAAFMTPMALTLTTTSSTDDAYQIMRNGTMNFIPVLENACVVGLLQTRDLMRHWSEYMDLQAKRLVRNYDHAMSVIAHDLRTPIGVIQTTNAMLTSGEVTPKEYIKAGLPEIMQSSCEMMLKLIDDILDIQKIKQGSIQLAPCSVDVPELIGRIVRAFTPIAAGKRITLQVRVPGPVPKIAADPLRLEQVLNNLISNALKFTPEGGSVVVGTATRHSQIALWVTDTGPGIAACELSELFKEYPQLSNRPTKGEKSTGLGLAITKRLVEAHGGSISVETTPGLGTTFTVLLPIGSLQ